MSKADLVGSGPAWPGDNGNFLKGFAAISYRFDGATGGCDEDRFCESMAAIAPNFYIGLC